MRFRYHIPIRAVWRVEASVQEKAGLERAIILAIERAVKGRAPQGSEIIAVDLQAPEDTTIFAKEPPHHLMRIKS